MAKTDKMEQTDKTAKANKADKSDSKKASQKNGAKQQDGKNEAKKERKQQAKHDAKLMLKIEKAKKDVQKLQQKVIKAQAGLNEAQGHLHELETRMESQKVVALLPPGHAEQSNGQAEQSSQTMNGSTPTSQENIPVDQTVSEPPAEGRNDISEQPQTSQASDTASTSSSSQEGTQNMPSAFNELPAQDMQIESDNASMPILTQDEHAWPPPAIREEVAEAIVEVVQNEKKPEGEQSNEASPVASEHEVGRDEEQHPAQHTSSENAEHTELEATESTNTQLMEHYGEESHQQA